MYQYDEIDHILLGERVLQFRGQLGRHLAGSLGDDEFRQLRLRNGLYEELHAHMLRVAVPYGLLSSRQMRMLAHIARTYDRGYGHFTTRQNIQFNWPRLHQVPDILSDLARVEMHAIQTSGNVVRNVTSDPLAGVAPDEIEDPRPYCEILRQWSTLHPEFNWLPRKFKIAVSGAAEDRAATRLHDIGLRLVRGAHGEVGFEVLVGGGMGRTPVIGKVIRPFLERRHLLSYVEAILRVYNVLGRRDNLYKARIKILVNALGPARFAELVETEWRRIRTGALELDEAELARVRRYFAPPAYAPDAALDSGHAAALAADPAFARWTEHNVGAHRVPGYRVVHVSLKEPGGSPGDIMHWQMEGLADLAERFSFAAIRSTHEQNLVLADVRQGDLYALWRELDGLRLATPNIGTLTDIICCPGLDYCSLANAGSIAVAQAIGERFQALDELYDLGEAQVKISGCMNACGHHHVGHIGILGVEKNGEEWYQIMLGGAAGNDAALAERIGPAIPQARVADAIEAILGVYVRRRLAGERFLDTYRRIGIDPFKEQVYEHHSQAQGPDRRLAACG